MVYMNPSYPNSASGVGSGGQPQQPVFGAGGMQTPISSGVGDIMLAPEKKSHKGVIIALILAVLIIGGLFVVMFLMPKSGGNINASEDIKLAFNRYANYLLYGKESDAEIKGEYNADNIYYIDEMRNKDSEVVAKYFETANGLLSDFESLVGNTNNDLMTVVNDYRADFELVRLTFGKIYIDDQELVNEVMNNNLEATKVWINNKYSYLVNSNYDNVKQYAKAEVDYYEAYADYLEKLKSGGCLSIEEGITCEIDGGLELDQQVGNAYSVATGYTAKAQNKILSGCWTISAMLYGGSKE